MFGASNFLWRAELTFLDRILNTLMYIFHSFRNKKFLKISLVTC